MRTNRIFKINISALLSIIVENGKRMGVFHMSEQYTTGVVVTGKVTGIQDYGAFVALDAETQGLVHISEITNGYVKDIHDF